MIKTRTYDEEATLEMFSCLTCGDLRDELVDFHRAVLLDGFGSARFHK